MDYFRIFIKIKSIYHNYLYIYSLILEILCRCVVYIAQIVVDDSTSAGHNNIAEEEDAAVKIQAFYRGYQTRRDLADKREKELYGPGGKPGKKKKGTYPKPTAPLPPLQHQQPVTDLQQTPTTLT